MRPYECKRSHLHSIAIIVVTINRGTHLLADFLFCCRTKLCKFKMKPIEIVHIIKCGEWHRHSEPTNTYSVVNDFSPVNASCAIREILLFDKSIRRNRLKLANAFGAISVMKFCSNRLYGGIIRQTNKKCDEIKVNVTRNSCKDVNMLTAQRFLLVALMAQPSSFFRDSRQFHRHNGMDVDNYSIRHIRPMHFLLGLYRDRNKFIRR